jgi:hypothetical protein
MSMRESMPPSDQARVQHMAQLEEEEGYHQPGYPSAWVGWVTFAAFLLMLLGIINGFKGFLALFDEGYFVAKSDQLVLVSYEAWGPLLLLWAVVLIVTGAALNARRSWARWAATLIVMVDVVLQVGFFPSLPLLATTLIAIDVVVLFALTARWTEAKPGGFA